MDAQPSPGEGEAGAAGSPERWGMTNGILAVE